MAQYFESPMPTPRFAQDKLVFVLGTLPGAEALKLFVILGEMEDEGRMEVSGIDGPVIGWSVLKEEWIKGEVRKESAVCKSHLMRNSKSSK
jgi:hypothetical protein